MRPTSTLLAFDTLVDLVLNRPRRQSTLLIGIDGPGGSGKSTFAAALCTALLQRATGALIIHTDDFFCPFPDQNENDQSGLPDGEIDWNRLLEQVITPIRDNRPGRFQKYDWPSRTLAAWHTIDVGGTVIIEGIRALHRALAPTYDFRIWLECPREVCLARGIARDGEEARRRWEQDWLPADDRFIRQHRPAATAELIVDGAGKSQVDPGRFLVCVRMP
jgi:uridine kinase